MQDMPNMLAYTIQGTNYSGGIPFILIGQGTMMSAVKPQNMQDDSYWIVILDSMNPKNKVKEWVIPGANNTSVPADLDSYMSNPQYIFAIVTQYLSTLHVPQGELYNYLVKYGAGRQLQRLEQINSTLGCGYYGRVNYLLTGGCGPRGSGTPPPPSYELGVANEALLLLMSLMPMPNGQPPYTLCDSYTFDV